MMFLSKVKLLGKEFYLFPAAKNTPLCSIICLYSYLLYEKIVIKTNVISIVQKNKYDDLIIFFFWHNIRQHKWVFPSGSVVKNPLVMQEPQEMLIQSLG